MDETRATFTPVLNLEKAGRKQKYDIGVHNANYDKIDNSTGKLKKDIDDKLSKSAGGVVVGDTEFKEAVKALHFETGEVLPKGIRQEVNITRRWLETYHAPTKEDVGVAKALDDKLKNELNGVINKKEDKGTAQSLVNALDSKVYKKSDYKGNAGWLETPNGYLLQWGHFESREYGDQKRHSVTYPIAYKKTPQAIFLTDNDFEWRGIRFHTVYKYSKTEFSFITRMFQNVQNNHTVRVNWFVIGLKE